ncbi:Pimeloyl-ACP methyl ester carboxylesterase [Brevibacterium sandarakinum]|uniref:Pimeloyl-ACP methyl ester carboxylesterase n=1 Tax=Brevibacterium sandarakinum TaxID=629680 RepID=A0A1H1PH57_BRESA|nr:alpha/beta hydrolase [Brevibacterium sandarakinum]SDS10453.1 Pimeloyl-ACP methyl ester carboxylesterase [Brevibacterium sandarakinum]
MFGPTFDKTKLKLSNGSLMPIVQLGCGPTPVVTIPGAGDGITTAYEAAQSMAWFYRRRAPHQHMHIISRREDIPVDYDIADHAHDYIEALDQLRLGPVILECNSAGGPIGQTIAAHRPDLVRALVLASTAHKVDADAAAVIESWLSLIGEGRWAEFGWDITVKTYRSAERFRWAAPALKPILGAVSRPENADRLQRILQGILEVDNSGILDAIDCPTLVFGGTRDPVFDSELQRQMAQGIPQARFVQAKNYLHGADLESPDYPKAVVELIIDTY